MKRHYMPANQPLRGSWAYPTFPSFPVEMIDAFVGCCSGLTAG
jgi:hypothetical protein